MLFQAVTCICSRFADGLSPPGAAAASDASLLGYPCREGVPLHLLYPPVSFASGLAGLALTSHGVTSPVMTSPAGRGADTPLETTCTCECGRPSINSHMHAVITT